MVLPGIYGDLFADAEMAAVFSDAATLQGMLDFESALARDEAAEGIIPAEAAPVIAQACRADLYDMADIGRQTTLAGNPASPMVKLLTAKVAEADKSAARWGIPPSASSSKTAPASCRTCCSTPTRPGNWWTRSSAPSPTNPPA